MLSDVQRRRLYDSSAEFKTTERPNRSNSKKYTARNEKHEESDAFDEEDKYFRRSYWSMRRPTQGEDVYESIKINLLESEGSHQEAPVYSQVRLYGLLAS